MRSRILGSYLALAVVVLVALEVPLGVIEARRGRDALREEARRDATSLAVLAAEEIEHPSGTDLNKLARRYRDQTGAEVSIVDRGGRPLISLTPGDETDGADIASETRSAREGHTSVTSRTDEGQPVETAIGPVSSAEGGLLGAVQVSVPSGSALHRVRLVIVGLVAVAVLVLTAVVVVGWRLAAVVARPLDDLQAAAGRLGQGVLSARVDGLGPPELRTMAAAFNRMAERIEELVGDQRRFVADASHQLRSPLTALRLRLETIEPADQRGAERRLAEAGEEVARLSRLVDGLLRLARTEDVRLPERSIDVSSVVADRLATWGAYAEERGVAIRDRGLDRPHLARTIPGHIEQILDNLLANAIEVSPEGSSVHVSVEEREGLTEVRIQDEGPGMTVLQRRLAFGRFWQGDRPTGESGLGLAISRQLARASKGDLVLDAAPSGGLSATVELAQVSGHTEEGR